jgi:alpha-glucosidase/alpha-D-xyloside xylohydrolase
MKTPLTRRQAFKTIAAAAATTAAAAQETAIELAGRPVEITLSTASPSTVRISIQPLKNGQSQPIADDGVLAKQTWGASVARLRTLAGSRSVPSGNLVVNIAANPLTIRVDAKDGRHVQELKFDSTSGNVMFPIGDSPLLGLGEGGPQFDRRGNEDRMVSGQGGYKLRTHGGRVPVQFAIGTAGWAMFIHQPVGSMNLTGKEGVFLTPNAQPLPYDIFVIGAKEPAAVMKDFAEITGYAEMAPKWSFGYQQSHRTLGSPEEIIGEAKTFREKKLPCDAMIYLGTGFCPNGWNTDNGEFTWNSKPFPDPKRQIQELHDEHFKVVLHIVFEGSKFRGKVTDPCAAPEPSGRDSERHWPQDRHVGCYWPNHKPLIDLGVDGWWPDQGDGLDPLSRLTRNKLYYEGEALSRPNQRVYALHRNGMAGMQKFAAFLWSGDVFCLWETLKNHIPNAVNTALSGIAYWGTDIGGFVPTPELSGELYVRWFQFAAFCPLFRSHGRTWKLRLPWGWNTGETGPVETQGVPIPENELHNAAIEPICKKYLNLRYETMPYLYSLVHECHSTGMPILRAMWLHYPDDATAVARGDQYLWGRDMLVAPVVEKGATERKVYLPHGVWYDYWTGKKVEGGQEITVPVDLGATPLYARAGAVIPTGPLKQYTEAPDDGSFTVNVYPGANGSFLLYEDDGKTYNFRKGEWMGVQLNWNDAAHTLTMDLAPGSKMMGPRRRNVTVKMGDVAKTVTFEGKRATVRV